MNTDSLTDTSVLAPEDAARRARKEARRNQLLCAAGAVLQGKRSDEMSMRNGSQSLRPRRARTRCIG